MTRDPTNNLAIRIAFLSLPTRTVRTLPESGHRRSRDHLHRSAPRGRMRPTRRRDGAAMGERSRGETKRVPVQTTYHGVEVTEDYRWLEDAASEETQAWTKAQHERTDGVPAGPAGLRRHPAQAEEILDDRRRPRTATRSGAGHLLRAQAAAAHAAAVPRHADRPDDTTTERVVVDPNAHRPERRDDDRLVRAVARRDLVAVSCPRTAPRTARCTSSTWRRAMSVDVQIPHVNSGTAGGSMAWRGDASGFWYTRHPAPGERPEEDIGFFQEVWFHELGGSTEDRRGSRRRVRRRPDRRALPVGVARRPLGAGPRRRRATAASGRSSSVSRARATGGCWPTSPTRSSTRSSGRTRSSCSRAKGAPHGEILRLPMAPGADRGRRERWSCRTRR